MKTLNTLLIAATLTLTGSLQVVNASNNNGGSSNTGTYGITYGGYWRTNDEWSDSGWGKHDDMDTPHWINNWNDCFYKCKDKSNCKGIEFQ